MEWNLTVFEPVVLRNTVGENLRTPPAEDENRFLFCAKASGDRNETPATRTSRKRNARVEKRGTPARVAESKQGGGYRAVGTRFVACFRAHAFAPAGFGAGRLPPPDIRDRKPPLPRFSESRRNIFAARSVQEFHLHASTFTATVLENQNIITSRRNVNTRPPPLKIRGRLPRPASGDGGIGRPMPISRGGRIGSAFRRSEAKPLFFRRI